MTTQAVFIPFLLTSCYPTTDFYGFAAKVVVSENTDDAITSSQANCIVFLRDRESKDGYAGTTDDVCFSSEQDSSLVFENSETDLYFRVSEKVDVSVTSGASASLGSGATIDLIAKDSGAVIASYILPSTLTCSPDGSAAGIPGYEDLLPYACSALTMVATADYGAIQSGDTLTVYLSVLSYQ